jgi:hypothetical protein
MSDDTNAGQPEPGKAAADRDAGGRFAPGNNANPKGRPRRPDIYALVQAHHVEAGGTTLDEKLVQVVLKLIERAMQGNEIAAKLILDRLTDSDPVKLEVSGMDPAARVAQIKALLQSAAMRQEPGG